MDCGQQDFRSRREPEPLNRDSRAIVCGNQELAGKPNEYRDCAPCGKGESAGVASIQRKQSRGRIDLALRQYDYVNLVFGRKVRHNVGQGFPVNVPEKKLGSRQLFENLSAIRYRTRGASVKASIWIFRLRFVPRA